MYDSSARFDDPNTYVVYDGECPFCMQYVKLMRLREAVGAVKPVNARDDVPVVRFLKSQGVNLNEEMALVMKGEVFTGPDCMHRLALMSTGSGFFNSIMSKVFASRGTARFLYPFLRTGRNLTLRAMGRKPIV